MATDVRQAASASTAKHDAFIEAQLARTERRIRALELATALLGFVAGTLAYAVLMALLDRQWVLAGATRQLAFAFYLLAAALYLGLLVVRPLFWRINPYYAARRLEQTLPGAKNSVVNWIDLHAQKLPVVIRGAVGQRAARDLGRADLEKAISGRRAGWAGATTALLAVLFVGLFIAFGPQLFGSLLGRAFLPFGKAGATGIATRTQVKVVQPVGGDTTVTIGNPLTIIALVEGRLPDAKAADAPHLLYWYEDGEEPRKRYLQPEESGREWATTLSPLEVGNGFRYKVSAGDDVTPEHRVAVRATPLIADFLATYNYRPYVARAPKVRTARKLDDLRGTEVVLVARTNRTVKEGKLHFEAADGAVELVSAEKVADDPEALRFRHVLDKAGNYRIRFTSLEGETYLDPLQHDVVVRPDLPPQVRLTEPAPEVTLPANGALRVKGQASDDIGVAGLTLRLQVVGGPALQPRPYRNPDKLRLPNGGHPRAVDYQDRVELDQVKGQGGKPFALEPGMEVEYWLEARDGCDFHRPNVTESKPRHRVKIAGTPKDPKKQEQERREAEKQQQEHEAKQDQQLKQEDKDRQEQRKEDEAQAQKETERHDNRNKKDGRAEKKPGEGPEKKGEGEKKDGKDGAGAEGGRGGGDRDNKDDKTQKQAEGLKKALERKGGEKGKAKEGEQGPGQPKGEGQGERKGGEAGKKPEAEDKGAGGQGARDPAGQGKEGKEGKPGDSAAAKGEGKKGDGQAQGAGKEGGPRPPKADAGPGQPKGKGTEGKPQPGKAERGTPKSGGSAADQKDAAEGKPEAGTPDGKAERGRGREAGAGGKPADGQPQGGKKEGPAAAGKCESKGPGTDGKAAGEKATTKDGATGGKGGPGARGAGKPGKGAGAEEAAGTAKGERRPPRGPEPRPEDAKVGDVDKLAEELKGPDRQDRTDARRQLGNIERKAKDPKAREAAKRELDKEWQKQTAGRNKPGPADSAGPPQRQPGGPAGEPKPGGEASKEGAGTSRGAPPPGERQGEGKGKAPGKGATKGPGTEGRKKVTGGGKSGPAGPDEEPDDPLSGRAERPEESRASQLQLEEFRKSVDPDVLKDAKMSPEQFEKFLRDYADLAKRRQPAPGSEKLPAAQRGGTLGSGTGRRDRPRGTDRSDLRDDGRGKAPPGYGDFYKDFLRRVAQPDK